MRLLSHNLLICNVAKCDQNNFPLIIEVNKSVHKATDFDLERLQRLIQKLDWQGLHKTVTSMGEDNFPKELTPDFLHNQDFMRKLHRIVLDTHIVEGKLICPNCKRQYPVVNGIPNMILHQHQI